MSNTATRAPDHSNNEINKLTFIIPAKNEERGLSSLLPALKQRYPDSQIIVVSDGSSDGTAEISLSHGCEVLGSPYCMGNGAAIKRGARRARGEIIVTMDADGQHQPSDIPALLSGLEQGYDMVVGSRTGNGQASIGRGFANAFYNRIASWVTGHDIRDLTSGFRAVRAKQFKEFLYLFPNGFSYPTTVTMAFFRSGYAVQYQPVTVLQRIGTSSHIRPLKDGVRFLLIIFKIATLYSPLKLFVPAAAIFFASGVLYYAYTFSTQGRFTNMSLLLFSASVIIFLIGLVSEQITSLLYGKSQNTD